MKLMKNKFDLAYLEETDVDVLVMRQKYLFQVTIPNETIYLNYFKHTNLYTTR